jgi:hypothetical protein
MSIIQDPPAGAGARPPGPGWTVPGVGIPAQRAGSGAPATRSAPGGPGALEEPDEHAASDEPRASEELGELAGTAAGSAGLGHPIVVAVASCLEALDGIRETSAVGLTAKALRPMLLSVAHLVAALCALKLRLLVAAEVQRVQDLTGATSVPAFLAHLTQMPRAEASAQVRLARDLDRRWPLLAQALATGRISPEHVKIAVTALRRLPKDLTDEQTPAVQQALIEAAQTMTPRQLKAIGRRLWEVIDPDGAEKRAGEELEDEEELARAKAYFRSWRNGDGTTGFRGKLPDVQADIILKALAAFASPRRRTNPHIKTQQPDDNHATSGTGSQTTSQTGSQTTSTGSDSDPPTSGLGDRPDGPPDALDDPDKPGPPGESEPHDPRDLPDPLERAGPSSGPSRLFDADDPDDLSAEERETGRSVPYPVRLGHALIELLERFPADLLPATGGVGATIVVTVDLHQLISGLGTATLDTGTEISIAQLRRLACEAGIIPAVLDGEGQPLDLGREQRLYTRPQRIAMNLRDNGCRAEGCDRPAAWTVAHHLNSWAHGGHTDIDGGAMVCEYHHHLIHSTKWTYTLLPNGKICFRRR